MKRIFAACLMSMAIALSGCVSQTVAPEAASKIKTVGVISAVGNDLSMTAVAIIAFGNEYKKRPIVDWGIDKHVIDQITKQLAGRYTMVPVSYDPADFDTGQIGDPRLSGGLAQAIRTKAATQNVDAYVVVMKDSAGILNTNQTVTGLGIARRAMIGGHDNWAHAIYEITVVDGHTFKALATLTAVRDTPMSILTQSGIYGPYREVDDTYWAEAEQPFTEAQRTKISATLIQLLDDTLPPTLHGLKLLP